MGWALAFVPSLDIHVLVGARVFESPAVLRAGLLGVLLGFSSRSTAGLLISSLRCVLAHSQLCWWFVAEGVRLSQDSKGHATSGV